MDFYGLGTVSLSASPSAHLHEPSLRRRLAFSIAFGGDFDGVLLLEADHLPVESDRSSALELLNVLSARIMGELHQEGIDLALTAPVELDERARRRLRFARLAVLRSWSGIFAGALPFEFELCLAAARSHDRSAALEISAQSGGGKKTPTEETACLSSNS